MKQFLCMVLFAFLVVNVAFAADANEEAKECTCPCPCPGTAGEEPTQGPERSPKVVTIKALVDVYEAVEFTHESHSLLAESCRTCHHRSTSQAYEQCVECHPVKASSPKGLTVPGLRGAFHRQCRDCHIDLESGPTECADCHAVRTGPSSFGLSE